MRPDQRLVNQLPLTDLWNAIEPLQLARKRIVGSEEIADLLRQGSVRFVLAQCGQRLTWVPADDGYRFWKDEAKPHLVEAGAAEEGFQLEDFPGDYCYVGSEWEGGPEPVILLEMYH